MAITDKLTNIANAIREKTNKTDKLTLEQMVSEIKGISTGGGTGGDIPEGALDFSGACNYLFYNGKWDWVIDLYGNQITTDKLTLPSYIFQNSLVESIPFTLNFSSNKTAANNIFDGCKNLKVAPYLNGLKPDSLKEPFKGCYMLRELPQDYADCIDWTALEALTSAYSGDRTGTFNNCYSLRSFPIEFFNHYNPKATNTYSVYYNGLQNCYSLDEVIDLPVINTVEFKSNAFVSTFTNCHRLSRLTFKTQADGTPFVAQWRYQVIDLSQKVGWVANESQAKSRICGYNSGITEDKAVKDDTTYQALKNDKDWYSFPNNINDTSCAYSRFNKESVIELINSLPDTVDYVNSFGSGYANTIKLNGADGSGTDGGAIQDLDEATIALSVSKGWTVTFV